MGHFQKKVAKNRFNWYKALGVSQRLQDQLTKQGQEPPLPNKVGMSPPVVMENIGLKLQNWYFWQIPYVFKPMKDYFQKKQVCGVAQKALYVVYCSLLFKWQERIHS